GRPPLQRGQGVVRLRLAAFLAVCGCAANSPREFEADSGTPAPASCRWRDAGNAGLCTQDSECPANYYCDFTVAHCTTDAGFMPWFGTVIPGPCLPMCAYGLNTPCHSGEDCGGDSECFGNGDVYDNYFDFCTLEQPCDAGTCGFASCGVIVFPCPANCPTVF